MPRSHCCWRAIRGHFSERIYSRTRHKRQANNKVWNYSQTTRHTVVGEEVANNSLAVPSVRGQFVLDFNPSTYKLNEFIFRFNSIQIIFLLLLHLCCKTSWTKLVKKWRKNFDLRTRMTSLYVKGSTFQALAMRSQILRRTAYGTNLIAGFANNGVHGALASRLFANEALHEETAVTFRLSLLQSVQSRKTGWKGSRVPRRTEWVDTIASTITPCATVS